MLKIDKEENVSETAENSMHIIVGTKYLSRKKTRVSIYAIEPLIFNSFPF